jgi:hyperosmotically inducible protein
MNLRTPLIAAMTALVLLSTAGCAVTRGQETVGAYVDDATITTKIKARFVDNKDVDASAISVETLNGTVMLSGFAKNMTEKSMAEKLAREVSGVKQVKNEIAIRP